MPHAGQGTAHVHVCTQTTHAPPPAAQMVGRACVGLCCVWGRRSRGCGCLRAGGAEQQSDGGLRDISGTTTDVEAVCTAVREVKGRLSVVVAHPSGEKGGLTYSSGMDVPHKKWSGGGGEGRHGCAYAWVRQGGAGMY